MSHRGIPNVFLPLAMAALFASVALGKSIERISAKGKVATETVTFSHVTVVNGTTLQPGEYRIVANGNELKVEDLNDKVVAECFITWGQSNQKFGKTKVDIDRKVLTKISLGGTRDALLLHRWTPGNKRQRPPRRS
jgi:hypothetical protein